MKTEVVLCDECKLKVAKYQCDFCGKDVCNESCCRSYIDLKVRDSSSNTIAEICSIIFCRECSDKYYTRLLKLDKFYEKQEINPEIKSMIVENLKKQMVILGLK